MFYKKLLTWNNVDVLEIHFWNYVECLLTWNNVDVLEKIFVIMLKVLKQELLTWNNVDVLEKQTFL